MANKPVQKVLVVDDEEPIQELLKYNLEKSGYDVKTASDGFKAVDIAKKFHPDLVLLDIMMPDVDGYEICRHIKKTEKLKHIHVAFMSAKTKEADIQKGYDLGASLYITKPFSTRELIKQVKELIGTK